MFLLAQNRLSIESRDGLDGPLVKTDRDLLQQVTPRHKVQGFEFMLTRGSRDWKPLICRFVCLFILSKEMN